MHRPHNRSGRQRWLIQYQQPIVAEADEVDSDDLTEMPLTTWPNVFEEIDAEFEELSGGKRVVNGQPQSEQRWRITHRWFPGVRQNMRIVWPLDDIQRILNLESVVNRGGLFQEYVVVAAEIFPEE